MNADQLVLTGRALVADASTPPRIRRNIAGLLQALIDVQQSDLDVHNGAEYDRVLKQTYGALRWEIQRAQSGAYR